jgi:hypothetical protein
MSKLTYYLYTADAAEYIGVAQNTSQMGRSWRDHDASESCEWLPIIQTNRLGQIPQKDRQASEQ